MNWTKEQYAEYQAKKAAEKHRKLPPADNTVKTAEGIKSDIMVGVNEENGLAAEFTVPLNPVTKKNHSRIVVCGNYRKILPSKAYEAYAKQAKILLRGLKVPQPINYPINLKCVFYLKERRKGDLVGYLQAIQDVLAESGIIEDDNRNIVASVDGSAVLYDKKDPRTEITITAKEEYNQW